MQNNDPFWANQIKEEIFQLFYTTPKKKVSNVQDKTNKLKNISSPQVEGETVNKQNTNQPHSLNSTSISYRDLQLVNPKL